MPRIHWMGFVLRIAFATVFLSMLRDRYTVLGILCFLLCIPVIVTRMRTDGHATRGVC